MNYGLKKTRQIHGLVGIFFDNAGKCVVVLFNEVNFVAAQGNERLFGFLIIVQLFNGPGALARFVRLKVDLLHRIEIHGHLWHLYVGLNRRPAHSRRPGIVVRLEHVLIMRQRANALAFFLQLTHRHRVPHHVRFFIMSFTIRIMRLFSSIKAPLFP